MKHFDNKYLTDKIKLIAGTDEAGRGPLAGPVVAAAVIFDEHTIIKDINDSKKLSEKKRLELFDIIKLKALAYGIGIVDYDEIDRINILQASLKAMKIAVDKLSIRPDLILIDGNKSFVIPIATITVVKGDSKSQAIAAASILAKVTRDGLMKEASKIYPGYSLEQNKGYPTKQHRDAVKRLGPSAIHRLTFLKKIFPESEEQQLF